jgi:hypothetical protein
MTAESGYVWFLPVYISMRINSSKVDDISNECNESDIKKGMDGHFALSYASFGNDNDFIDNGTETIAMWKEAYLSKTSENKTKYADYSSYTFDAVWVYVKALKQLIKEGMTCNDRQTLEQLF